MKNNIHQIMPRQLPGGFIAEYSKGPEEVGGLQVIIWRNARRDDGFMIYVEDLAALQKLMRHILTVSRAVAE